MKPNENDFQKATIRIYHDGTNSSNIILPVLNNNWSEIPSGNPGVGNNLWLFVVEIEVK